MAPPVGVAAPSIDVAEEEALIVWDEQQGIEHFVRRATFRGETRDFGILVPTPTRPELVEFDEAVFQRLSDRNKVRS